MNNTILQNATLWATNNNFDAEHRKEVQALIDTDNQNELTERFYKDLEFGTGGLRSIIGIGTNRINKYTVGRATQAMANVILEQKSSKNPKVAISYDSRNFSFEFAQVVAEVFSANNIQVWIYKHLNPVPLLSFAVRELECAAGVMVTASHNPPEYNGYKAYGSDGSQLIPPMDGQVIDQYNSITNYESIKSLPFEEGIKNEMIRWIPEEVETKYYSYLEEYCIDKDLCQKHGKELGIVYTAIHGTGHLPCTTILKQLGFSNLYSVPEQKEPNGDFPTVTSPNPENPEALDLAVQLMQEKGCDIVFGSDPDTDRLGLAYRDANEVIYLNGNQIGTLMLHYVLETRKKLKTLKENSYFVNTIVTSPLQNKIAKSYGVESYKTLTGFKWICGKMNQLEKEDPSKNFIFATEESFGYLNHPYIRDKDGVGSVSLMAEVTLFHKTQGKNLSQAMDEIYEEFGFSQESLINKVFTGKEGSEKIHRIMEAFRTQVQGKFGNLEITKATDLQKDPGEYPPSNVLGFHFSEGSHLYVRPSGTEPKVKFYLLMNADNGSLAEKKKCSAEKTLNLSKAIEKIVQQA